MLIRRKSQGYSLLEVVMAMAALTIIMGATLQIIGQGSKSYRSMRTIQNNLENAQFVISVMAKELRTSSVVASATGAAASVIHIYDYSQDRCIEYRANEATGTVTKRSVIFSTYKPNDDRLSCLNHTFAGDFDTVLTGLTNQVFYVDPSTEMPNPHLGRVSIAFTVGTGGSSATVQTTVALRDFNFLGI